MDDLKIEHYLDVSWILLKTSEFRTFKFQNGTVYYLLCLNSLKHEYLNFSKYSPNLHYY